MYSLYTNSNKKITNYMLNILSNFNENLKLIDGIVDELLMVEKLNKNPAFLKFIVQLNESRYCSLKCEGYMDCLNITDFYTPPVLCNLLKNLTLLLNHYRKAFTYLKEVEMTFNTASNEDFDKLLDQIKSSAIFINSIAELIKLYNTDSC